MEKHRRFVTPAIGVLWNLANPFYRYYGYMNWAEPLLMRALSLIAILLLCRFYGHKNATRKDHHT